MKQERAIRGRAYEGRSTWYGQFRDLADSRWYTVRNVSELPIAYATREAAIAGAKFAGAAWRINERSTNHKPYTEAETRPTRS